MPEKVLPPAVFITGGGKCGTHVVCAFAASRCPDACVYTEETPDWSNQLANWLEKVARPVVFHSPSQELKTFKLLCPNGTSIVMLRNPVQQYLAWFHALQHWTMRMGSFYNAPDGASSLFHFSLARVVKPFYMAAEADEVWRLEDFTSSERAREQLLRRVLPISDSPLRPFSMESKSNIHSETQAIVQVSTTAYRDALSPFERDALLAHRDTFEKYYPKWSETITVSRDYGVVKQRYFEALRKNKRLRRMIRTQQNRAVRRLVSRHFASATMYLLTTHPKYVLMYPRFCWKKRMDTELDFIATLLPQYSATLSPVSA